MGNQQIGGNFWGDVGVVSPSVVNVHAGGNLTPKVNVVVPKDEVALPPRNASVSPKPRGSGSRVKNDAMLRNGSPINLHNAHLPSTSSKQKAVEFSSSRINNLLGIPTTSRRHSEANDRELSQSPGKNMFNSLLGKSDKDRERHPSGGSRPLPIPGRWNRRGSLDLAISTIQAPFNAAKINSSFLTSVKENACGGGKSLDSRARSPSTKNRISKAIKSAGSRIRRPSADQGPISIKPLLGNNAKDSPPKIPEHLIYEPSSAAPIRRRGRALTISNGHAANASTQLAMLNKLDSDRAMVPTVFRYAELIDVSKQDEKKSSKPNGKAKDSKQKEEKRKWKGSDGEESVRVYIAGTMTSWESREMVRPVGDIDYCVILECSAGDIYYKFCICKGGEKPTVEWLVDNTQEVLSSNDFRNPVQANVIRVKKSDRDVFEALSVDSFNVRESEERMEHERERREDLWTQRKPSFDGKDKMTEKGPPILPPHLLQVLLNKEELDPRNLELRSDRVRLPDPSSHVMLNHLYAQSIRDNVLVLASTNRFRKKCVTVVYYKSLENS